MARPIKEIGGVLGISTATAQKHVTNLLRRLGAPNRAAAVAMVGGDGACMGCGEKTAVHLIVSAIHASMQPHVTQLVTRLDALISALDQQARDLLSAGADLEGCGIREGVGRGAGRCNQG